MFLCNCHLGQLGLGGILCHYDDLGVIVFKLLLGSIGGGFRFDENDEEDEDNDGHERVSECQF